MDWKQDRILTFIWSGQFLNDDPNKKFYFDTADQAFFNLYFEDNQYKLFDKRSSNLTDNLKQILLNKIEKIKANSSDILEIEKVDHQLHYSSNTPAKTKEEFKQRMGTEKEMAKFAFKFLEENNIDLELANVIELY